MKKLLTLSLIAFFALSSAKVFAQGSGIAPEIGSTHTYFVNVTDNNNPKTTYDSGNHTGDTYTWEVMSWDGSSFVAAAASDYTIAEGGSTSDHYVDLTWNPSSYGKNFYVKVIEETTDGCSNVKMLEVIPSNDFQLAFTNVGPNSTTGDLEVQTGTVQYCAPDIALSLVTGTPNVITYDYGVSQLIYQLSPSGIHKDWNFTYQITEDVTSNNSSVTAELTTGTLGSSFTAGTVLNNSLTVDGTAHNQNVTVYDQPVYLVITVTNHSTTDASYNEGTIAQNLSVLVRDVNDGTNLATQINSTSVSDANTSVTNDQEVKARPKTTTIGYN